MQDSIQEKSGSLYKSLSSLCNKAIERILKHKSEGKLIKLAYENVPVAAIDYLMGTYHFDWANIEYFDVYEWGSMDLVDFITNELSQLPEFDDSAKEIVRVFEVPKDVTKKLALFNLMRLLTGEVPNGYIDQENVDYYIETFINDYVTLKGKKLYTWEIELWLGNVYFESEEIAIAPDIIIRRPTKEELSITRLKTSHIDEFERMTGRGLASSAILSFTVKAGRRPVIGLYPEDILREIETWMNIFRLFKPSNVIATYQTVSPISIFEHPISQSSEQPSDTFWQGKIEPIDTSSYKLYVKTEEEDLLRSFVQKIKPVLSAISRKTYLTGSSYDLALHRYNDALLKSEVNAYKILSSISSIEALLSDGTTEITYKMRLRMAKLLGYYGFDPIDIYKKIDKGYTLRSKLVHGASTKSGKGDLLEFAREHTHEIVNFNRICLLIALQLKNELGKDALIEAINYSFIDSKANEKLKMLLDEKVIIPVVNPWQQNGADD